MIVYAPRKVTLAPHRAAIDPHRRPPAARPARRRISGAPAVPRHSAGYVRSLEPAEKPPKGLHFQLIPVYGVTIPVIVRLGNLQATAGIANVHLEKKDGKLGGRRSTSTRSGTRSTFGEVRVLKAGVKDPIARPAGVASLYRGQFKRHVEHPARRRHLRARSRGRSRSQYRETSDDGTQMLAEPRRCFARASGGGGNLTLMLGGRNWLRKAAMLLALCAGGVAASAPPLPISAAEAWTADPDDQFLLDVNIRQLRLGDGVRAYNTPEGTCVVLGDFLTTLDVPMRIDLGAKKASGWAFKESNRISIDYGAMRASYPAHKSEPIAPGTIRETPEGWCVQAAALSRWFGIGVKPVTSGSVLMLQSDTKLPVELAMERQLRAQRIKPAKFDLGSLPQVRLPYRMWRAPALDFVVSAGVTYRANDGMQGRSPDPRSTRRAKSRDCPMMRSSPRTRRACPTSCGCAPIRSDPDGDLLGPAEGHAFRGR